MQPLPLSDSAKRLVINLSAPAQATATGPTVHVADIGATFYFAYEQLRNVAEYREHHLLLRSAIERYLHRYVRLDHLEPFANDLVVELTQAGYLQNDTVSVQTTEAIDTFAEQVAELAQAINQQKLAHSHDSAFWLYQYASVHIESLINPDQRTAAVMQFAYEHYLTAIDPAGVREPDTTDQHYRIALYCAIQHAIFKSDLATIRYYCLRTSLGEPLDQSPSYFVTLNLLIDDLSQDPLTSRLSRIINRYGAPMRVLRELVFDGYSASETLTTRSATLARIKLLCAAEYERTHAQLNQRIIKSILFILITKTIVGIAVEIPYDLAVYSHIVWQPLLINILFPPLYMAVISSRIRTPSSQNTELVTDYVDRILYEGAGTPVVYRVRRRRISQGLRILFNSVYAIGFIGSIALLIFILKSIGFNLVAGVIFFLFFSAVSFLGLRLRRLAHELQLLDEHHGLLEAFIDFLSTPFVAMGHWLSDKYSRMNIITLILDLAIEMPFKTFIRLTRQWVRFLRDKQDEL
jgi:hypothetical protein